jgi:hypothetical protein
MPDVWDAAVYRQRAEAWRKRAAELTDEPDQAHACIEIADRLRQRGATPYGARSSADGGGGACRLTSIKFSSLS